MYFSQGKTQREIAEELQITRAMIIAIFKDHGWKARPARPRREEVDSEEVYRLYFEEELSQREVAETLGLKSMSPVQRVFKENGWVTRGRWGKGATYDRRCFTTDDERKLAIKTRSNQRQRGLKELRERLFGTVCRICGKSSQERSIATHRKDFKKHEQNTLWLKSRLESLKPEEWVALCTACHRGVHWLNERYNREWYDIDEYLKTKTRMIQQIRDAFTLPDEVKRIQEPKKKTQETKESIKKVRKRLFGAECDVCSESENRRIIIHRKDGRPHQNSLLWSRGNLESLNPDEWVALCQKCHRYVHWAEDNLGLSWDDLSGASLRSDSQLEEFAPCIKRGIEMI
jgi:DNA-binding XRE family transcriptional regulator